MTICLLVALIAAIVANETSRAWLTAVLFGESELVSLGLNDIEAEDLAVVYSDDVYQVYNAGFSTIQWLTGVQARNLVAFGVTIAYVA